MFKNYGDFDPTRRTKEKYRDLLQEWKVGGDIFIQSMTSNCHTFFLKKKLQKSVTIWEHLPKR